VDTELAGDRPHRPLLHVVQAEDRRLDLAGDQRPPAASADRRRPPDPGLRAAAVSPCWRGKEAPSGQRRELPPADRAPRDVARAIVRGSRISSLLEDVGVDRLDGGDDHRLVRHRRFSRRRGDRGRLMRYAGSEAHLTTPVAGAALLRGLVFPPGFTKALSPGLAGACIGAVDVESVAGRADPHLRPAAGAVRQTVAVPRHDAPAVELGSGGEREHTLRGWLDCPSPPIGGLPSRVGGPHLHGRREASPATAPPRRIYPGTATPRETPPTPPASPREPEGDIKATPKTNFGIRPKRRNQAESNGP
jgi:hypothetical protein